MTGAQLFEAGKQVIPGGVCSSTRLNQALGWPIYVVSAEGSRFTDVDGNGYIDMCCSHGAGLLGHGHPAIRQAIRDVADAGICCSFDGPRHVELARKLCEMIPCAERVRFTNSGTEATLHALRVCRAYTGRDRIIRFTGHFHGYHEYTYIGGHPPREALDDPAQYRESPGIPEPMSRFVIPIPFNDIDAAEAAISTHASDAGTVILEPVNYNSGCVLPEPGYLQALRELCDEHGMLLFFDEVQSSFKKSPGGAQEDFGVIPDICTIGKAVGGGVPLSAICGRAEIMDRYKPAGDVQHSGTFNAHLLSIMAGLAFCSQIEAPDFYPTLLQTCEWFAGELDGIIAELGVPVVAPYHGARFGILMGLEAPPRNYVDTLAHRADITLAFIREAFARGVYFHDYGGGPCHHGFSAAHTRDELTRVLDVCRESLAAVKDMFADA